MKSLFSSLFQMVTLEQSPLRMQFVSIQKSFSVLFPPDGMKDDLLPCHGNDYMANEKSSTNELLVSQSSDFIDLSSCMQDTQVTVPTLNGYPSKFTFIVYVCFWVTWGRVELGIDHKDAEVDHYQDRKFTYVRTQVCINLENLLIF